MCSTAQSRRSRSIVGISLAVFCAVAAGPSTARSAPAETTEQDNTSSVFVPDSPAALERFALAQKLESAREWAKAAEIYQELLDKYRDRVVSNADAPGLYTSVADRALQQLARWPTEGLIAYNGKFQPAADAMLQQAHDPVSLQRVVDRYLLTQAGGSAASQLLDVYWQNGQAAACARLAEQMVGMLPEGAPERAMLLYRGALAWRLAGVSQRAAALLEQLRTTAPEASDQIAGRETKLVDALVAALAAPTPTRAALDSWPSYGGSPDRAAIPAFGGRSDALLFSKSVTTPRAGGELPPGAAGFPLDRSLLNQTLGIHPVYDNRQLFFQDGEKLYGVSIDGGLKLPNWPDTSVQLATAAPSGPMLRTLALSDDCVYCVLADLTSIPWVDAGAVSPPDNSAVVCIDRLTGKTRWRITPQSLAQATPSMKSLQFASPPLVVDDRLFIAARGGRNAQFHDVYLLSIARSTGKLTWSSYVASGPNLNLLMMEDSPVPLEAGLPQLSYSAGRVIVVSNVGAVAAVDAVDGTLAWLRVYARSESAAGRFSNMRFFRRNVAAPLARIFASSPAIVSGGNVFALPIDGKNLLVLDEADGRVLKQIPRASMDGIDTLIALSGRQLVVAGEHIAATFDWTLAREDGTPQTEAVQWKMDFPANSLRGRPFFTTDSLFLPTDDRLLRVSTDHWKIEQTTPPYPATWQGGEGPGNVLVTQEHVVVATNRQVNVYTNLSAATARLDREIAAEPGAVEPLVRYGELLFAAGQSPRALEKFQAALHIIPPAGPGNIEVRDRLFNASLLSAARLAGTETNSPQVDGLLEVARESASAPSQRVQYHLAAATIELRRNNGPESLKNLQAILDEQENRMTVQKEGDQPPRYASEIARRQISQLIDRFGASVYQQVQIQAQRELALAQQGRSPAALIEIASKYPNSNSAIPALILAGQLDEQAGRFPEAASVYRRLVQDYSSSPDAAGFVESMARAYAAIPGKARVAATRLAQAAAAYANPMTTQPLRLPDGQIIKTARFSEVADALKQAAGLQRPPLLPDLRFPPFGKPAFGQSAVIGDVAIEKILPVVPGTSPDYSRAAMLLTGGDVAVVSASQSVMMRSTGLGLADVTECAWVSPTRLLLRSAQALFAVDLTTGQLAWRVKLDDLPAVAPLADAAAEELSERPEEPAGMDPRIRMQVQLRAARMRGLMMAGRAVQPAAPPVDGITEIAVAGGHVIAGTSTGRVFALEAQNGALAWQIQPDAGVVSRVSASDDFVAVKTIGQNRSILTAVDNSSGKVLLLRSFSGDVFQNILVSDDGQLVYTTPAKIASKDLYDQSDRLLFEVSLPNPMSFNGQDQPDQLIMVDDTIAAVTDNGTYIRLFSRYTGKQVLPGGRQTNNAAASLPASPRLSCTKLVAASPFVYAYNQSLIRAINLQRAEFPERRLPPDTANLKLVVPGAMHLVAVEQPTRAAEAQSVPELTVFAFSRAPGNSGESGRLDHLATIKQDAGIVTWQLVEGGMFISLADKRLVFVPTEK